MLWRIACAVGYPPCLIKLDCDGNANLHVHSLLPRRARDAPRVRRNNEACERLAVFVVLGKLRGRRSHILDRTDAARDGSAMQGMVINDLLEIGPRPGPP
jgi:hypothetical protein